MLRKYRILLFTLLALTAQKLAATHIVGGEILYKHIDSGRYDIRLNLFVDCLNGSPFAIAQDATAYLYIFNKTNGDLLPGFPIEVARNIPERIVKLHYNCLANAPNACVDYYIYDTTLYLPPGNGGYIISFQRCCRNNSISNLVNPGAQGANYWTTIPDTSDIPGAMANSSAYFNQLPPNFLCTNAFLQFDHSATDIDGDSLVYDLFQPYTGANANQPRPDNGSNGLPEHPPFSKITWLSPYDELNPIDGSPPLNIDPVTGKLTLTPIRPGQYVAGIRVREYRKGVLISETRRDYQFNVADCDLTLVAGPGANVQNCDSVVQLQNNSIGAQRYSWDFGIPGINSDTSNQKAPLVKYPHEGIYKAVLKVYKNNCIDSAESLIRLGKHFGGNAKIETDVCKGEILLTAATEAPGLQWLFDNKTLSDNPQKLKLLPGNYLIQAAFIDTIAGCNDTQNIFSEMPDVVNDLRLANCFTPGDDGKNDCYYVGGRISECIEGEIKIFNRWGELVYHSNSLSECWNGTVENTGPALPAATYFYLLELKNFDRGNGVKRISGCIELIRD